MSICQITATITATIRERSCSDSTIWPFLGSLTHPAPRNEEFYLLCHVPRRHLIKILNEGKQSEETASWISDKLPRYTNYLFLQIHFFL